MTIAHPPAWLEDEFHVPEAEDMGSINHSYLQSQIATLFQITGDYVALTELSLDSSRVKDELGIGDSIVPDVAIYQREAFGKINWRKDQIKADKMPLLVIEILSPMQAVQQLIDKLAIYFRLGVQSCWLVYPSSNTVEVYSAPYNAQTFVTGDIDDKRLNITLAIDKIFRM